MDKLPYDEMIRFVAKMMSLFELIRSETAPLVQRTTNVGTR